MKWKDEIEKTTNEKYGFFVPKQYAIEDDEYKVVYQVGPHANNYQNTKGIIVEAIDTSKSFGQIVSV